ncbi:MAG TPA: hypothetical protein VGX76_14730, partial [Pirellulales bacterium]|nr:hypothetical protein [Pirellulales bacterium]
MSVSKLALAVVVASLVAACPAVAQAQSRLPSISEAGFEYNSYYSNDGGSYYSQSDSRPPSTSSVAEQFAVGTAQAWCDECGCDDCGCYDRAACEECGGHQVVLFGGFDSWRGVADRPSATSPVVSNNGTSFGFNYGTRLGEFSEWTGIGFQLGASYGVFDWSGRQSVPGVLTTIDAQQQVFLTTGFFKRADEVSAFSYGLVHDWMFNQAFGAFAVNPTLGQWRAQVAYATDACNEFGVWGTLR